MNRNAQIGALASLSDDAFRAHVVAEVARGRDDYYAIAAQIGCGALRSLTNFVCIDFETNERATAVMNGLLAHGVFVRKPAAPPLDKYVRISVGSPAERVEFGARLRTVLGALCA